MERTVSVIGLGKLGSPLAACVAAKGFRVIGVDLDPRKVEDINQGRAPVFEPQLEDTIRASAGRLIAHDDVAAAVAESEITFIVVATPSEADGSFSLRHVLASCEAIGRALRAKAARHLVVLTSTVMPGSTGGIVRETLERASGKRVGRDFGLCYNPEFIALGSVIHDFLNPDFLLIGESDPQSGDILEALYRQVCENQPGVARMNFVNAEIAKLSVNTYVTTKISFANMLARICEALPDADVDVVSGALGLDTRIGIKYLKGAVGYGGPCFPRDNRALVALARQLGAPADIAHVTDSFNRAQVSWLADLVERALEPGSPAGILGLTYKPEYRRGRAGRRLAPRRGTLRPRHFRGGLRSLRQAQFIRMHEGRDTFRRFGCRLHLRSGYGRARHPLAGLRRHTRRQVGTERPAARGHRLLANLGVSV